jgi:hypothetical protein
MRAWLYLVVGICAVAAFTLTGCGGGGTSVQSTDVPVLVTVADPPTEIASATIRITGDGIAPPIEVALSHDAGNKVWTVQLTVRSGDLRRFEAFGKDSTGGVIYRGMKEAPVKGSALVKVTVDLVSADTLPVYTGDTLANGFAMGINTSGGLTNWLIDHTGYMECAYPASQAWGAVFITTYPLTSNVGQRNPIDASSYTKLALEMKGAAGGEQVSIGAKTPTDPDNGNEPKYAVGGLTTDWQDIQIPLSALVNEPNYPATRFASLYVVCELVFEGSAARTVFIRNVRFVKQ